MTYDLEVRNNGPAFLPASTVLDNLPAEVTFVSCQANTANPNAFCTGGGGSIQAGPGPLSAGQTVSITIVVRVVATSGLITNTAVAFFSSGSDTNPANNTSTSVITIGTGPPFTATPTVNPPTVTATPTVIPPTLTPTPISGGGGAAVPALSPWARLALVLLLLAAGGLLAARRP